MLLEGKTAVIHGGGGAIGGAVARQFAREGAHVFLAGRSPAKLERVARDIADAGGLAEFAEVDALDADSVLAHADHVAARTGRIDIALNAVGFLYLQGSPLHAPWGERTHPAAAYSRTNLLTARAAARHMIPHGSGVVLTLAAPAAEPGDEIAHAISSAVDVLSRLLASELEPQGVRVTCVRPDAIPGSLPEALAPAPPERFLATLATGAGILLGDLAERARSAARSRRMPTLAEFGSFAALLASDPAAGVRPLAH